MRLLKALATAQAATIVDFVLTVLLSSFLGVYYVVATTIGAVSGGITNCIMNYRWVFPGSDRSKYGIAWRYFVVWLTSILLNVSGTYLLTEMLKGNATLLSVMGKYSDQVYIISKIIVAVLVAICWNYQMQRVFVYRKK